MLKDFIRQSVPWTTYLIKMKAQNKTYINYNPIKNQKVINEFYSKIQIFINSNCYIKSN